jgi:hypothetical protein
MRVPSDLLKTNDLRMKHIILASILLVALGLNLHAQRELINNYGEKPRDMKTLLGITSGLNNPGGLLGIRLQTPLNLNLMADFSAGLGTWGYKAGAGLVFNAQKVKGLTPFIGLAVATGISDFPLENVDIKYTGNQTGIAVILSNQNVSVKLPPRFLLNLGAQWQVYSLKGNRFFFEFGYSIPIIAEQVSINNANDGSGTKELVELNKRVFNFISPGGLMLGFNYLWAM